MKNTFSLGVAAFLALSILTQAGAAPPKTVKMPDGSDTLIIPAASPLHFHGFDKKSAALFNGEIVISGTYYYGNDPYNTGDAGDLSLVFVPDTASLARLPHFKTHVADVTSLGLDGENAFATIVVPKDKLAALRKAKDVQLFAGKVGIKIDHFRAWISCQNDNFSAHFVSVTAPAQKLNAESPLGLDC